MFPALKTKQMSAKENIFHCDDNIYSTRIS